MSTAWSVFIVVGSIVTLAGASWFLWSNWRAASSGEVSDHEFDGIVELHNPLPSWWVGFFFATIIFAVGYVVYYPALGDLEGVGAWSAARQHAEESARYAERFDGMYAELAQRPVAGLLADRQAMQIGRRLFVNNCAACHGVAGAGATGYPDLTDAEWVWDASFDGIVQSVSAGRQGVMPGWGAALGAGGVDDMVEYVLALSAAEHDAAAAERGKNQYAVFCVACHAADGAGISALGAPNLTNNVWLYGGSRAALAQSIAEGRTGIMPGHDKVLGPERVKIVAAYVTSLRDAALNGQ